MYLMIALPRFMSRFDLVCDATTLVFFQLCGQEIHWIDCLSDTGRGLDYYVKKVREKPMRMAVLLSA